MIDENRVGSSFDDFLEEQGLAVEVNTAALKRVLAWQAEGEAHGPHQTTLNRLLEEETCPVKSKR